MFGTTCTTRASLALLAALSMPATLLAKDDPREVENLRREVATLEALRAEKLETLERREAARWDARYKAVAQTRGAATKQWLSVSSCDDDWRQAFCRPDARRRLACPIVKPAARPSAS